MVPSSSIGLTPREWEVVELIAEGMPRKKVAANLGISQETVNWYVARIADRIDATGRPAIAIARLYERTLVANSA